MILSEEQKKTLTGSRIFSGLDEGFIANEVIRRGKVCVVSSGELIIDRSDGVRRFGIILSGRAAIYSSCPGKSALLRIALCGDPVGIAGLYSGVPISTDIIAAGEAGCTVFILSASDLDALMNSDADGILRRNLLVFLSDRVAFLNGRINCVTGGQADRRLARLLMLSAGGTGVFDPGMSSKSLADILDIGRASLYRAVESLENEGVMKYQDGKFYVQDAEKLISINERK
jgi:CRP-like cAMP-binding protein